MTDLALHLATPAIITADMSETEIQIEFEQMMLRSTRNASSMRWTLAAYISTQRCEIGVADLPLWGDSDEQANSEFERF
jgi:hypothetical protein